tara:strand:+ start:53 stop:466 length:414 start_codon:yes stop_codon:yes gene_type:complete
MEKNMNISDIKLPSNQKFGFFFTIIFLATGIYFYLENNFVITCVLTSLSIFFFVITLLKADLLLPLNKFWMRIGLLLGMIISPIVLGLIFFGMFVPTNLIMRISGRDELHLRFKKRHSHWILRKIQPAKLDKFKYQF